MESKEPWPGKDLRDLVERESGKPLPSGDLKSLNEMSREDLLTKLPRVEILCRTPGEPLTPENALIKLDGMELSFVQRFSTALSASEPAARVSIEFFANVDTNPREISDAKSN